MEILGFHMSRGRCGLQIVSLMMAGSALCARRATRKTALRGLMFMLAPAVFALCSWPATAQNSATYTYTGNPQFQGVPQGANYTFIAEVKTVLTITQPSNSPCPSTEETVR